MNDPNLIARIALQPDLALAVAKYRTHAAGYDATAQRTMAMRRRVVGMLGLRPGDTVLDVACGTGLSLPLLRQAVGPAMLGTRFPVKPFWTS